MYTSSCLFVLLILLSARIAKYKIHKFCSWSYYAKYHFQPLSIQVGEIRVACRTHNPGTVTVSFFLVNDHLGVSSGTDDDKKYLARFTAQIQATRDCIPLILTASVNANCCYFNIPCEANAAVNSRCNLSRANNSSMSIQYPPAYECNESICICQFIFIINPTAPLHINELPEKISLTGCSLLEIAISLANSTWDWASLSSPFACASALRPNHANHSYFSDEAPSTCVVVSIQSK